MKKILLAAVILFLFTGSTTAPHKKGKYLFILSGQSNMAGLHPEESFTPAVEAAFGKENVIVVKSAYGGQPIRRWYQNPGNRKESEAPSPTDLYDSLMNKVRPAIKDQKIAAVTFIWMQGERDAREKLGDVYEENLLGLYHRLAQDLKRKDMFFIIGRLSDFGLTNSQYPHWNMIRDIQVKLGESDPKFSWIDTDDLNDGKNRGGQPIHNDLHMSGDGYVIMGKRFAEKAIALLRENRKSKK